MESWLSLVGTQATNFRVPFLTFCIFSRPKKVKEDLDVYSFTFNVQRPPMGSIEAKFITSLLDAKGASVVATKEIFCHGKPNMLVFSVLPTYSDDARNNTEIKNIQNLVTTLTSKKLKLCLYFLQLKTETSLVDSNAVKFDGESLTSQCQTHYAFLWSNPLSVSFSSR